MSRQRPRAIATTPHEAARDAGLRYVSDADPGIRRRTKGQGVAYVDPAGRTIRDRDEIRRIRALVIPPAWIDVWICPSAQGHIQATGRDGRGRKQYRYHPRWRAARDATKYGRMVAFAEALPAIRARVAEDLARPGLGRETLLAAIVRLLETTRARVGNEEYARTNGAYGLTTLRSRHADVTGTTVRFRFRGNGGKLHEIGVRDRRLARIVQRCQDLPGQELFQYVAPDGTVTSIGSSDVNTYVRAAAGDDFTAKDFRTWAGTVLAATALEAIGAGENATRAKRNVTRAIQHVADALRNTATICRRCYVHPAVIEAYESGVTLRALPHRSRRTGLEPAEQRVLALLRASAPPAQSRRAA